MECYTVGPTKTISPIIDKNDVVYAIQKYPTDKILAIYPNGSLKWEFDNNFPISGVFSPLMDDKGTITLLAPIQVDYISMGPYRYHSAESQYNISPKHNLCCANVNNKRLSLRSFWN